MEEGSEKGRKASSCETVRDCTNKWGDGHMVDDNRAQEPSPSLCDDVPRGGGAWSIAAQFHISCPCFLTFRKKSRES